MKLPKIWKKEMEFPRTPLNDIHSGYSGTPDVWKEFFIEFIENYEHYKDECILFEKSDFSQLKSEYLDFIKSSNSSEISKFVEFLENYKINRDSAPLATKVKKTKK